MGEARTQDARFIGVSEDKTDGRFVSHIGWQGKTFKLGRWERAVDAAIAFDRASLWLGRQGELNLPAKSVPLGARSPEDLRREARMKAKIARGSATAYTGVRPTSDGRAWIARVQHDGAKEEVSGFETAMAAAIAHDRMLLGIGGDLAKLNFPDRRSAPITAGELRAQLFARRKSKRTSRFFGVSLGPHDKWHAEIYAEARKWRLGEWADESDAAEAYDRAALFFRGASARLNFPDRSLRPTPPSDLQSESRAKRKATCSSKYHGVTQNERNGATKYVAEIRYEGILHIIGHYDDEVEAATDYDRVALHFLGDEAKQNFPDKPSRPASLEQVREEKRARYKQTTTSRYHGVSWKTDGEIWVAGIEVDYVYYFLGHFDDEELAALAYDRKRHELLGVGPYNFPDDIPE